MVSDAVVHAVAGAAGGMVAMASTYPLVSLSVRAQVETKKGDDSTLEAAKKVIQRDGISGLYDGLSSSLGGIAVTNAVFYGSFEAVRDLFVKAKAKANVGDAVQSAAALSTGESMLASALAGAATSVASNPIWVVNTRQSTASSVRSADGQRAKKLNAYATLMHIVRQDGVLALWSGLGPALILVINYTAFEQLKALLIARRSGAVRVGGSSATSAPTVVPLTDFDFFILGAISKLIATTITYPYLTVKSRQQAGTGAKYKNAFDGLATIYREEGGLGGLYRGYSAKIVQSVLTAAILFMGQRRIYEIIKAFLIRAADAKAKVAAA